MSSTSKKYFAPINNFDALREVEEKYRHKPTEKEIRDFLEFWQSAYDLWRVEHSPFEDKYLESKIKTRKLLVEKLGIRN